MSEQNQLRTLIETEIKWLEMWSVDVNDPISRDGFKQAVERLRKGLAAIEKKA